VKVTRSAKIVLVIVACVVAIALFIGNPRDTSTSSKEPTDPFVEIVCPDSIIHPMFEPSPHEGNTQSLGRIPGFDVIPCDDPL
jgi:hypothetical protein